MIDWSLMTTPAMRAEAAAAARRGARRAAVRARILAVAPEAAQISLAAAAAAGLLSKADLAAHRALVGWIAATRAAGRAEPPEPWPAVPEAAAALAERF